MIVEEESHHEVWYACYGGRSGDRSEQIGFEKLWPVVWLIVGHNKCWRFLLQSRFVVRSRLLGDRLGSA